MSRTAVDTPASDFVPPRKFFWTVEAYETLSNVEYFSNRRVELVNGEILEMPAMNEPHALAISFCERALRRVFSDQFWIRLQMPFRIGKASLPEPDIAVLSGTIEENKSKGRPTAAALIVECSDSTLAFDLEVKAHLYASADVPEYWVIDVANRKVLVHRRPARREGSPFDCAYDEAIALNATQSINPLGCPTASIAVADLLP